MDFDKIKNAFEKYVSSFDSNDDRIELKRYHTHEVAKISYQIAEKLGLNEEQKNLARLIGYLHDIGRFPQLEENGSFSDKNYDHATKGVEVLFEQGLIRKFIEDDKYDDIIKFAVEYHNKLSLPEVMNEEEKLFGQIIRDADKIDIYRINSEFTNNDFLLLPSEEPIKEFMNNEPVKLIHRKNKSDSVLCVIAFINDINFQESLDILNEYGYFDNYLKSIHVSEENKEIFDKIIEICNVRKKVK